MNNKYTALQKEGKLGLTALMERGTQEMQKVVEVIMDELGSTGKA